MSKPHPSREELEHRIRVLEDGIGAYIRRYVLKGHPFEESFNLVSTDVKHELDFLARILGPEADARLFPPPSAPLDA